MSEKQNTDNQNIIKNNVNGINIRLLEILFWGFIISSLFLRFNQILSVGLTTSEADALTRFGAMQSFDISNIFKSLSWNAPLSVVVMRLSSLCGEPPVYGRYIFAAAGVWSLFLIGAVSRRNSNIIGGLITVILAGFSAMLITLSQEISIASLIIWVVLALQWTFMQLRRSPNRKRVIIYLFSALIGILLSPSVSFVIFAQLIWLGIFAFNKNINKTVRTNYVISSIGAMLIATPFFVLQWIKYSKNQIAGTVSLSFNSFLEIIGITRNSTFTYLEIALIIVPAIMMLIALSNSFIRKKGEARVWGTVILFVSLGVMFSPFNKMGGVFISLLLPFFFLLVAQGFIETAGIQTKFRGVLGKIFKYTYIIFVIGFIVFWMFEQCKLYDLKLQNKIERDLSGPSAFLEKAIESQAGILLVSDINMYDWLRTRYYFYNYLTSGAKTSFEQIDKAEWQTNFANYLPDEESSLWLVGVYNPEIYLGKTAFTNITFPYSIPVVNIIPTSKWDNFKYLNQLHAANSATPLNRVITDRLLNWYRGGNNIDLEKCVNNGFAGKDIASGSGSELYKKAAANRVLYAWKECDITNFFKFDKFVNETRKFNIDSERVIHLYSIFTEKALKNTNLIIAVRAVESAKMIDPENPFLNRLAAKIELLRKDKDYNKIVDLNKRASVEYEKRYGKKYINAQFANASAYRAISNYPDAFASCGGVLSYYADEIKMPISIQTNLTESGKSKREKWTNNQLAWIGRCNSFISSLFSETGDYENAILWETKNLDENNSEARRTTSRERLAKMYTQVGGVDKAFQYLASLANSATSVNKRISWKLEGAQVYVTIGDTVSTYDRWEDLQKEIEKRPMEERWKWSKDKRYQRILRYLSGRSQMDIRNPVIVSLERRAAKGTNATVSARLRVQIAEIYKCMLQYNKTDEMFNLARKTDPSFFDSYLDDGLLQYRMKRYAKAEKIFTNVVNLIKVNDDAGQLTQDWRYIILEMLVEKGIPPSLDNVLSKIDESKPYLNDLSDYYNHYGNALACYGKYDMATNQFTIGIQTNELNLQNHLDLGYLICRHSDAERAGKIIDTIMALDLSEEKQQLLETDWRFIILHHVSVRPYNLKE